MPKCQRYLKNFNSTKRVFQFPPTCTMRIFTTSRILQTALSGEMFVDALKQACCRDMLDLTQLDGLHASTYSMTKLRLVSQAGIGVTLSELLMAMINSAECYKMRVKLYINNF